jgi:predicted nucleic acid-binding protein
MPIVVSDTSPLLNLARIGRLELLRDLYQSVIIPPAVQRELSDETSDLPIDVTSLSWISVISPHNRSKVVEFAAGLDAGESEALTLAVEIGANQLLVDEKAARRVADALGISYTGLLGVLLESKRASLIGNVRSVMDELIEIAGFWVDADLYRRVLEIAGEG